MSFKRSKHKRICIKSIKKDIIHETDELIKSLESFSKQNPIGGAEIIYKHLSLLAKINSLVAKSLTDFNETTYLITSLYLQDSFNLLNRREVESVHFVTGPEIGNMKILDHRVNFKLEHQDILSAKGDSKAVNKVLIKLSEYDFKLWGYFHIHPGSGVNSIYPSHIDLKLDRLLKRGGYKAVGVIFSRDGFIRFFSSRQFKIQIYGKGLEKINETLYHFVKIS